MTVPHQTPLHRTLRAIAYLVLPAEALFAGCAVAGVALPAPARLSGGAGLVVLLVIEAVGLAVLYRRGGAAALREVVPEPVRRLLGHELRIVASLLLWPARRRVGVRDGVDLAFGHAKGNAAMLFGLAFVCVIETFGMSVLLRGLPTVHAVVLFVDVYTVLLFIGIHAASVTRPHVLSPEELRVRHGAHHDLRIPLARIASARADRRYTHEPAEGVLNIPVASQTSLTLELTEPVDAVGLLGKRREVTTVRLHANEPAKLLAALRRRLDGAHEPLAALTPVRTAPSRHPGPPRSA
ncbi:hypothetical protein [Streptomyces flavofungini]|uniref:hypothetical protein n=1 Tax=Streptomyces flavofungini TaxID=68200 RepID=UPI0034DE09AE